MRTWGLLGAKGPRPETQDARDGATSEACHQKEVEGQKDHLPLRPGAQSLVGVFARTQRRLGLVECGGGSVARSGEARPRCALVAIAVAALCGLVLPLLSTVCDCGELTHHTRSCHPPWPRAMGSARVEIPMPLEDRARSGVMHLARAGAG